MKKDKSKVNTGDPVITDKPYVAPATKPTAGPTGKPADKTAVSKAAPAKPKHNLVLPVTKNDTGKVLIQTVSASSTIPYNSYIITSKNGESVVVDPSEMPAKKVVDINPAAIMCTHSHFDHVDDAFTSSYDVPKILYEENSIKTKDFTIYSIASAHNSDTIDNTNFLIVFEVDGLRIVHMGDIGQTSLTGAQIKKLGKIDIAFMQFDNIYSNMTIDKAAKLIGQINPKIIIPTHYMEATEKNMEEKYGELTVFENILEISKDDLKKEGTCVYKILNKHKYR